MSTVKDLKESAKKPADSDVETEETRPTEACSCSDVPVLAVRCDGRVLLSTVDLAEVDLAGREVWVGLVLSEAEASDIQERLNFEEAAAPTVARLLALDKKKKKKGDDDDDDGA